jgi:Zn finger protein HypA/HybF involved in hydrogenase expression
MLVAKMHQGHNVHDVALQMGFLTIAEAIRFALEEAKQTEAKA